MADARGAAGGGGAAEDVGGSGSGGGGGGEEGRAGSPRASEDAGDAAAADDAAAAAAAAGERAAGEGAGAGASAKAEDAGEREHEASAAAGATGAATGAQAATAAGTSAGKAATAAAAAATGKAGEQDSASDKHEPSPEERRRGFIHRRKPSWLNESHPSFVWGDQQTRKQIREEFHRANDELGGSHHNLMEENQGTDEEGDEEVDDNDLNYGVDPVITDINEELRVIEGMISEHTKLTEIEVDDDGEDDDDEEDDDDDDDDDDDVNLPEAPQPIRLPPPAKSNIAKALEKAEAQSLSSRRGPRSPRSGSPRGSSGLAKGSLVAATGTSASDSQGQSAAPSSASPPRAPGTAGKDAPAVAAQVVPTSSKEDDADAKVVISSTGAPADPKTVLDTLGKLALESSNAGEKQGKEDAATKQQTTQPSSTPARVLETGSPGEKASEGGAGGEKDAASTSASASTASPASSPRSSVSRTVKTPQRARTASKSRKKAVRMVELPDYLAMIAREHKQQLLEKQRLELAKAAEAVNRAEAAESGAAKTPRSEVMIRRGYLDRLGIAGTSAPLSHSPGATRMTKGIDMGINARRAAIASARTRSKPPSLRVQLREAPSSSKSKGFFKKIASWIASDEGQSTSDASAGAGASGGLTQISSSLDSASSAGSFNSPALGPKSRRVNFKETADVYYIPARSDFPAKVKNAIWHTRAEFVEMVMTNMDQLELEMQQEAEAQRRIQDLRNNPPPSYNKNRASKDKSASGDPAAKS